MLSQTTRVSLLERVAQGGDGAWREFHERYAELIYGFARRQGLQPADCDDVVQDALASLMNAMTRGGFAYDPAKGKFRSYLKTLTVHAVWKRLGKAPPTTPLEEMGSSGGATPDPGSVDVDAVWEAEWRQYHLRAAIAEAAAEFNRTDLAAFEMYVRQGRGAKETADALGLSVDSVYQAKTRILRRLSQIIERRVEEEG